ncbi:adult-specific rigid cuticular protein 15.7-like [Procambarus clarkii]|uniref:adult-specific rigid cuticular protein 15.7-like n=1 Tax=Procambarus clarkii TaxID=6728 RepID=UPI00374393F6
MNALTVYAFAALAACCGAQLFGYPGAYSPYLGNFGVSPNSLFGAPVPVSSPSFSPLVYNAGSFAPVQSQYHAQDELGQYSFGYSGGPSSKAETRDAFGIVRGSYNYVDANGKVQTQNYVADALGFHVAGTDLPVAPDAPKAADPGPLPQPVQDTAEVAAAKTAFKAAYDKAAAAAAAAPDSRKKRSVVAAPVVYSPNGFSYGFSAPLTSASPSILGAPLTYSAALPAYTGVPALGYTTAVAAPAATLRDAQLLRIVHNPGHAVSYRVD